MVVRREVFQTKRKKERRRIGRAGSRKQLKRREKQQLRDSWVGGQGLPRKKKGGKVTKKKNQTQSVILNKPGRDPSPTPFFGFFSRKKTTNVGKKGDKEGGGKEEIFGRGDYSVCG